MIVSSAFTLAVTASWSLSMTALEPFVPVLNTLVSVGLGFWLRGIGEFRRENRQIRSHFDALGMEIRRCGNLAATYVEEHVQAPLYRLPTEAYHRALPVLLQTGVISGTEADTFQEFYLQADQVNRGLDNVDHFLRGVVVEREGEGITLEVELTRLRAKAGEMRAQLAGNAASDLYRRSRQAFEEVFKRWVRRRWWHRK